RGFSLSQQQRIADLVLGQRGSLRKLERPLQDDGFAWQLICLRLACIVCQARDDDAVPARTLDLQRNGREGLLRIGARWSGRHPSTVHSLREEAGAWARQDGSLTLRLQAV
ncbi:MAG: exopolyphosphatase, partial [Burkholderiales bacterium]|nr:exopolyphosphatase [Burkholderiales bacterium]